MMRGSDPRPPTAREWNQLPPVIQDWIVTLSFCYDQNIEPTEQQLFLAHWVR